MVEYSFFEKNDNIYVRERERKRQRETERKDLEKNNRGKMMMMMIVADLQASVTKSVDNNNFPLLRIVNKIARETAMLISSTSSKLSWEKFCFATWREVSNPCPLTVNVSEVAVWRHFLPVLTHTQVRQLEQQLLVKSLP